jgi:hypothetical protein
MKLNCFFMITKNKSLEFKQGLIILAVILFLFFAVGGRALALDINVNASQPSSLPDIFKPAFFPWEVPNSSAYQMVKATDDGLLNYIYGTDLTISWNVGDINQTSNAFLADTINALKSYYSSRGLDNWLKNNNVNLVIGISSMPKWLSANPSNNNPITPTTTCKPSGSDCIWAQSPPDPACYDFICSNNPNKPGWAALVKEVVKYFNGNPANGNLGLNASFNVWHEPSWNYFYGTQQNYYDLYRYAVIGIEAAKAADPYIQNVKIAGPAAVGLDSKSKLDGSGYESAKSMMQDFIEYAGDNSIVYNNNTENVHINSKYPIDIISFSGLNQYGNNWKNIADQIKGWLSSKGYSTTIPLMVQELGTWNIGSYLDPNRDSEYIASYVINQISWLDHAGISKYFFTTLFDFNVDPTREFNGRNDLWTGNFVIKPVYNAFKALAIFGGKLEGKQSNRLQTNFNDNDFVTAIASQTQDRSKTRILLSNFLPADGIINQCLLGIYRTCMLAKGYNLTDVNLILKALVATYSINPPSGGISGITLNYLTQIINQTDFSPYNNTLVRADLINCNSQVVQKLGDLTYYTANPKQINLSISGLPFSGQATLTTYTIDKDHSNSCKANKATESPATIYVCGKDGVIDNAVHQSTYTIDQINTNPNLFAGTTSITVPLEGSKQETAITVSNGVYSTTLTIQPYSVILLEIKDTTPPVISSISVSAITHDSATVTWTTNEAANSQVEYGPTTSYGSLSNLNTSLVTSHSVNLSGLLANTTYHFRVKSRDAAGNLAVSSDYTFSTPNPADITPSPPTNLRIN